MQFQIYKFIGFGFFKENFAVVDHAKPTSLCTSASRPSGDILLQPDYFSASNLPDVSARNSLRNSCVPGTDYMIRILI
jgi:hypothetical protein